MTIDDALTHMAKRVFDYGLAALVVLALLHLGELTSVVQQGVRHGVQAALGTAQTTVVVVAPERPATEVLDDLGDEQWWTTTDCPSGVQVPCLDMSIPADELPAEVRALHLVMVQQEWLCLEGHGVVASDDEVVQVSEPLLSLCRAAAYAVVVDQPVGAEANGCWLENLGSTELPQWTWLAAWTDSGLCPGSI